MAKRSKRVETDEQMEEVIEEQAGENSYHYYVTWSVEVGEFVQRTGDPLVGEEKFAELLAYLQTRYNLPQHPVVSGIRLVEIQEPLDESEEAE